MKSESHNFFVMYIIVQYVLLYIIIIVQVHYLYNNNMKFST